MSKLNQGYIINMRKFNKFQNLSMGVLFQKLGLCSKHKSVCKLL